MISFMKLIMYLCFFPVIALSQVTKSSIALSTGGAGVAAVDGGEAAFTNPASIMHLRGRYFFTTFQKDTFAVGLIENDPRSAAPGSIGYENWKGIDAFSLSLADRAWGRWSAGITAKYYQLKPEDRETKRSQMLNGNVGISWALSRQFGLGVVFENIAEIKSEFSQVANLEPRTRLGLNYIYKDWFRVRLDGVTHQNNDYQNWIPQMGFETYFGRWMIGRFGWFREPGFEESWTAGLGFALPRFKIDYAYQDVNSEKSEIRHSIDLGIPF